MTIERKPSAMSEDAGGLASELGHWPVKLKLLNPASPFLKGADLILLADCAGVAYPNLHQKLLRGRAVAIGCPKFDDLDEHIDKLTAILSEAGPRSLSVVIMEVPCCRGLVYLAEKAVEKSGSKLTLSTIKISRAGEVMEEQCECGAACAAL
jgi:hypothetical protein